VTLLSALTAVVLVVLLVGIPVLVAYRDIRSGRPDPAFRDGAS
jgi:hypothetical protein